MEEQTPPVPQQNPPPAAPASHGKPWIKWVLIVIAVAILSSIATIIISSAATKKETVVKENVETAPQPTSTTDDITISLAPAAKLMNYPETKNWSLYEDKQAGFSIKYPQYMHVNEMYSNPGTGLTLIPQEGWKCTIATGEPCLSSYNVIVYDTYDGGSRRAWFDKYLGDFIQNRQTNDVLVDGVNALVIASNDAGQTLGAIALIPKANKMYTVYFYFTFGLPPMQDRQVAINKVLSTFTFTQ